MPSNDARENSRVQGAISEDAVTRKVDERVRQQLTKLSFLGPAGALLLAFLAYYHKDIIDSVVTYGGTTLRAKIDAEYKNHLATLSQTQDKLREGETRIASTRDIFIKEQDLFIERIARTRDEYAALKAEAEKAKDAAEKTKAETEKKTLELADAKTKVEELLKTLKEVSEASQSTRDRIVTAQSTTIAEVDLRYRELATKIAALQQAVVTDLKKGSLTSTTIEAVPVAQTTDTERKPTVYFQFAGFERTEAQAISNAIKKFGWTIPGEERTPAAVKTNEIRYNVENRAAAQQLEKDAQRSLRELNINIALRLRETKEAKSGFVEIWVYKP